MQMRFWRTSFIVISWLITSLGTAWGQDVIPLFSQQGLQGWQEKVFEGKTRYQMVTDGGKRVVKAESQNSASGRYFEAKIDLQKTPVMQWSWKIDRVLQNINEHSKAGDDFAARVYVVVSGGALFWKTRSLVYVWSSDQPKDSTWHNPYTANARHIVLRSGNAAAGKWVMEKRNIRNDFKRLFGEDIQAIDAVAIMTDTDNSDQQATAWYGDIRFSR